MNIEYCKEFLELSHSLNFTKAAETLSMHQSTLSKHIQALETELGTKLIKRHGTTIQLSETGYVFVGYATKLVETYEQAKEEISFISGIDPIRIDWRLYDQNLVSMISAALIINNRAGQTPVIHHAIVDEDPLPSVVAGDLDLAIVTATQDDIDKYELDSTCLITNPLVAIVENTHPFAALDEIHVSDLCNETLIHLLHETARPGWKSIEELCHNHGFEPKTRPVLVGAGPEQFAIPLNGCVLIFPGKEREVKMFSKLNDYATVPIADSDAVLNVFACYRKDNAERLSGLNLSLSEAKTLLDS